MIRQTCEVQRFQIESGSDGTDIPISSQAALRPKEARSYRPTNRDHALMDPTPISIWKSPGIILSTLIIDKHLDASLEIVGHRPC